MERNEKCFCGSGFKYKKCHLRINGESKLAYMYRAINTYDVACKEKHICNSCITRCSKCCSDFFFVSENEFLMIVEELLYRKEDITKYVAKAKKIMGEITGRYPEIMRKLDEYMPTSYNTGLNTEFFKDTFNNPNLPKCIFLDDNNKCSIYKIRPTICRIYGTTGTCEFINNSTIEFEEKRKMIIECEIIINSKNEQPIIKRPYPLFYWFGYFLDEKYYYATIKKVENIRDMKLDEFYNFNKMLI